MGYKQLLSTPIGAIIVRAMNTPTHTDGAPPDSRQALIDAIEAYLARTGVTRTGFGRAALGDACFLGRLARGSDVRLGTADKVLVHMGEAPMRPRFLAEIEAFMAVTRTKAHLFGEQAMGDPTFLLRLERGRSPTLATVDRVRTSMAEHASAAEREAIRAAVEDGAPAVPVEGSQEEETQLNDGYMDTKAAAAFLGLSHRTLERYRGDGKGPPFHRFGTAVRYRRSKVAAWAREREAHSTTEADEREREDTRAGEGPAASPPDGNGDGRRDG